MAIFGSKSVAEQCLKLIVTESINDDLIPGLYYTKPMHPKNNFDRTRKKSKILYSNTSDQLSVYKNPHFVILLTDIINLYD
jgi:hypothetical protein